jgi:hypothetical protein
MKKMRGPLCIIVAALLCVAFLWSPAAAGMNVQRPPTNVPAVQSPAAKKKIVSDISCRYTVAPPSPKAGDLVQPIIVVLTNTGTVPFVEHAAEFNCIGCGFDMSCPSCKDLKTGAFTAGVKAFGKQWTVPLLAPGATSSFTFNPVKSATGAPASFIPGPYIFSCYPNISNMDKVTLNNFEVKPPEPRRQPVQPPR